MKKIAVIGSGLMGSGIAQIFARQAYAVALFDPEEKQLSQALITIRRNLELLAEHGIGQPEEIEPALVRVQTTTDLQQAVAQAEIVFECVPENLTLKQKVFAELDTLCPPETVLATNTSVMSISEIAAKAVRQERIVGTHFWNPPFLIPLVEVIKGQNTADGTVTQAFELLKAVGKHPVRVNKDVPGFVANRLQHALWREAISIVERGIADAATVDECIRYGFGIRLGILGPLENADMVGTDLTLAIHDYILEHIENSPEPSPLLKEKVAHQELGFKSGQGFFSWSDEQAQESRTRLVRYLLRQIKVQEEFRSGTKS